MALRLQFDVGLLPYVLVANFHFYQVIVIVLGVVVGSDGRVVYLSVVE